MKAAERSMLGIDAISPLPLRQSQRGEHFRGRLIRGRSDHRHGHGPGDSGTEKKIIGIGREVPERPASALQGL
jgi:hypothetical protein